MKYMKYIFAIKVIKYIIMIIIFLFTTGCSDETKANFNENVDRIKGAVMGTDQVETAFEKVEKEKEFVLSFMKQVLKNPEGGGGIALMRPPSLDQEGNNTRYSYFEYIKKNLKGCAMKEVNPSIVETYVPTIEGANGYAVSIDSPKEGCSFYFAVEVSEVNEQLWVDAFLANDPKKAEWLGW